MQSKERVLNAMRRSKTDRPPTSLRCTQEVWQALEVCLGVSTPNDVLDELDIDLRWVSVPFIGPESRSAPTLGAEGTDLWGNVMKAAKNEFNTYYEIVKHPLAHVTEPQEVFEYDWPSLEWWDYSKIKAEIQAHKKKGDRAIMYFAGGTFETPWYMRGMERFFLDLYENPEIVDAICSCVRDYYFKKAMRVLDAADGEIDIIGSGGDIGGQQGMMIGPEIWRDRIKQHSAGLITPFRDMGLGTFYHSCGSLIPVIDDLIEIGVMILDPIQVSAKDMQPENLFAKFSERLCFHGAVDEVELLPHADPQCVYKETQRLIDILGANYGFIVSPSHQAQGDTPVDNILALFQAVRDYRY